MKILLPIACVVGVIFTSSGCSNSNCDEIVSEVRQLEQQAKDNFDYAMKNRTTVTKGSKYSVEYTRSEDDIRNSYYREMRIAARIITNNQRCFDVRRIAEAEELVSED